MRDFITGANNPRTRRATMPTPTQTHRRLEHDKSLARSVAGERLRSRLNASVHIERDVQLHRGHLQPDHAQDGENR
jgi:hypothetical protein